MAAMRSAWVCGLGLVCALLLAGCFGPDSDGGSAGAGGATGGRGGSGGDECECDGLDCCGSACVNLANDVLNCGSCGNVCPGPVQFCDNGVCGTPSCQFTMGIAELRVAGSGGGSAGSGFAAGAGGAGGVAGVSGDAPMPAGSGGVGGCIDVDMDAGAAAGFGGSGGDADDFAGAPAGAGGAAGIGGVGAIGGSGAVGGGCDFEPPPPPPDFCCGQSTCAAGDLCCLLPDALTAAPQCFAPVNGTCPAF